MSYSTYPVHLSLNDKPLVWLHNEIKNPPLSGSARLQAGFLLRRLQQGEKISMSDARPMPSVGRRCHEFRIVDDSDTWRIIYRIDEDAIVVLEVFSRKTQKTPKRVIDTCKARIKDYDSTYERTIPLKTTKRKKLERNGWKIGSAAELLGLTAEEASYVEMKLALSLALRKQRAKSKLTQVELAKRLKSSQSRVAKMEAGDPSVSIDLLVRSLLALGASPKAVAKSIQSAQS